MASKLLLAILGALDTLSTGSIARALANQPAYILADEPIGNLDRATGKKIFDLLRDLSRSQKTTIIVVTHDLEIARKTDHTFT